jgi:hypothetical protein
MLTLYIVGRKLKSGGCGAKPVERPFLSLQDAREYMRLWGLSSEVYGVFTVDIDPRRLPSYSSTTK